MMLVLLAISPGARTLADSGKKPAPPSYCQVSFSGYIGYLYDLEVSWFDISDNECWYSP